jgi:hypothetical protein
MTDIDSRPFGFGADGRVPAASLFPDVAIDIVTNFSTARSPRPAGYRKRRPEGCQIK